MKKEKVKKPIYKRVWFWVIIGIVVLFALVPGDDTASEPEKEAVVTEEVSEPSETAKPEETAEPVETEEVPEMTMGQKNALKAAGQYLDYTAFSYKSLIEQLEYEGYSTEDATFAADNCGADWKEQAVISAKNYLDYTAFSKDGLIEQLEYEGFTHEQAVYGAEQNGY